MAEVGRRPAGARRIARTVVEKTGLVTSLLGFGFRGRDWSFLNLIEFPVGRG